MNTKVRKYVGVSFGKHEIKVLSPTLVSGHDDSLPYESGWVIKYNGRIVCMGNAYNDGWGGDTEISCEKNYCISEGMQNLCREHFGYRYGNTDIRCDFALVIDMLVCFYFDMPSLRGKIMSEEKFNELLKMN